MTGERERKIRKKIPCERELGGNMGGGKGRGKMPGDKLRKKKKITDFKKILHLT